MKQPRTIVQAVKKWLRQTVAFREAPAKPEFYATVEDVRNSFGRWELSLRPVSGEGLGWVGAGRCRIIEEGGSHAASAHEQVGNVKPSA